MSTGVVRTLSATTRPISTMGASCASSPRTTRRRFACAWPRRTTGPATLARWGVTRRDGRQIPVDARLQEVTLPDGARTAILTARDISDWIDVQARLARIAGDERRQAAELRAVIQAMGEGIVVVDPSGRISLANDAAATILDGAVPADLEGLEDRLQVGPLFTSGPHDDEIGQEMEQGEAPTEQPRTARLHDGRWLEIGTYPVDLAGFGRRRDPDVQDRHVPRRHAGPRGRCGPGGVPGGALARAAYPGDEDLRRAGPRAPGPAPRSCRDARRHRGRGGSPVSDGGGPARAGPGRGWIHVEAEPLLVQHLAGRSGGRGAALGAVTLEVEIPSDLPVVPA